VLSGIPGWIWQVVGAAGGLALGLLAGALWLRGGKKKRRSPAGRASRSDRQGHSVQAAQEAGGRPSEMHLSQFPMRPDSPQQRLLERLRETNLDLSAQLRASAAQHSRLVKEKDEELAALKDDYDQRVEELRQTHSSELKHLMTLLVEQVDGIHKTHGNQVKALEAEIDRLRGDTRRRPAAVPAPAVAAAADSDGAATTTFANTELMAGLQRPH